MGTEQEQCDENKLLEINYKKYKNVAEPYIEITDQILDLAIVNIFELPKKFPTVIEESNKEIERLKKDIQKGGKLPPIIIEVDEYDNFVTIVDGFHRIIAYRQLGIVRTFAVYVERLN